MLYLLPEQSNLKGWIHSNGAVAQLVEQRTENPCVPGSSPGGATSPQRKLGAFLFEVYFPNFNTNSFHEKILFSDCCHFCSAI